MRAGLVFTLLCVGCADRALEVGQVDPSTGGAAATTGDLSMPSTKVDLSMSFPPDLAQSVPVSPTCAVDASDPLSPVLDQAGCEALIHGTCAGSCWLVRGSPDSSPRFDLLPLYYCGLEVDNLLGFGLRVSASAPLSMLEFDRSAAYSPEQNDMLGELDMDDNIAMYTFAGLDSAEFATGCSMPVPQGSMTPLAGCYYRGPTFDFGGVGLNVPLSGWLQGAYANPITLTNATIAVCVTGK